MKSLSRLIRRVNLTSFVFLGAFSLVGTVAQAGDRAPVVGGNSPPEVRLVSPASGAKFSASATIQLIAQGSDRDGWIRTVEFFANERSLGVTTNNPLSASAMNPFQLAWNNVPAGEYALHAKATDDQGAIGMSSAVKVSVLAEPPRIEVNVAAIKSEATEEGDSRSRTLIFRFVRSGSQDIDLPVFYSVSGTASIGEDFPKLTGNITIPKGAETADLSFEVVNDFLAESAETVVVRVEPPICIAIFPPPRECYLVGARAEARAVIAASDQPPTDRPIVSIGASVAETIEPSPEVRVPPGRFVIKRSGDVSAPLLVWLEISGSAQSGKDYEALPRSVVFEAGAASKEILVGPLDDQLVEGDETVLAEIVPVPPTIDTPYPTNYAIDSQSKIARVVIHDNDRLIAGSTLEITSPKDGAEFRAPAFVRIEATAIDPLGDIRLVDFYANRQWIGKSEHLTRDAVIPGRPRHHIFEWKDVAAGRYELVTKAKDTAGKEVISKPARIAVLGPDIPVVSIEATIGVTAEPAPLSLVRPGRFTISRRGGGDGTLPIFFAIGGSALNGEDYKKLVQWVIMPGGTNQVHIDIAAADDALVEGDESVEIKLTTQQPDDFPFAMPIREYAIDPARASASVVIRDNDTKPGSATTEITAPKNDQKFFGPAVIEIAATAIDPKGYISRVEFYAAEEKIGVSEITFIRAPDPGTPIHHNFAWRNPPQGVHLLTARSVDSAGERVVSKPVTITVERTDGRAVVSVEATDPRAAESARPDAVVDTATFTIRRIAGPRDVEVPVYFALGGTAQNGIDYQALKSQVTLRAGEEAVKAVVVPISDKALEGEETVTLRIEEPICPAIFPPPPACYLIARPGSAAAMISDSSTSQWPIVAIVRPAAGAEFSGDAAIEIVAEARDPDGYVTKMDFLADGRVIGAQIISFVRPPPPGETQTFRFTWRDPMPGLHVLTARATDDQGVIGVSAAIEIKVNAPDSRPMLRVTARDALAVEPNANAEPNTATFVIHRSGPTAEPLSVNYSLQGTAENGVDYEKLSGIATIPAGAKTVTVVVRPRPDDLVERSETVILQLETSPLPGNTTRLRPTHRAAVVIRDGLSARAAGESKLETEAKCTVLADGLLHLALPGETGGNFRVEVTSDFVNWETVSNAVASEGNVHFVDETGNTRLKFYRVVREEATPAED